MAYLKQRIQLYKKLWSEYSLAFLIGFTCCATLVFVFEIYFICFKERSTVPYHHGYRQALMNVRDGADNWQNYAYDEKKKGQKPED
jgi:hypothetical protein